jgi:hypothetical protein
MRPDYGAAGLRTTWRSFAWLVELAEEGELGGVPLDFAQGILPESGLAMSEPSARRRRDEGESNGWEAGIRAENGERSEPVEARTWPTSQTSELET